ncbi:Hypothetical protein LUCI_4966 [Lucifera butyrica]|uniref:Uncharacterized protein n=1 Tax=Lucifera butyrica TaxID=1351585 RepID=A0A498RKT0_9FIRM|nr:hypothetical protein [Lucifera butyrica]VBB09668.1 Hypothetical protein LUCI_4966 [Lucifera butyrica]
MADVGAPQNDIGYDQISGETSNYDPSAMVGNFLYRMYGDSAVVFNDAGTGYVRFYGKDYYTSLVTKGDWLYRKYGNSIIVRDTDGIAYARFGGGDWYVALLPRVDVSTQQAATTKEAEIAKTKTDMLTVDLNNSLAGAIPNPSPVVNVTKAKSDIIDYSDLSQAYKKIQTDFCVSPTNTAFVNAKLSNEDIANGYRLKYNPNGVLWRVNAAGIPHPDGIAAPNVNVKPIVEAGDKFVYSYQPDRQGVAALSWASLFIGTGDSFLKSLNKTPIRVIRQENNGDTRIIIQVGLNNRFFQENAGKTIIGSEDTLTNMAFRLTLDARHAQDSFTAYISINDNGQIIVIPKVYSGDKYEVGKSGFWGGSDFKERPISPIIIGNDGPYQSLARKLEEIFSR